MLSAKKVTDKKVTYRAPIEMRKMHTALLAALGLPSLVQRKTESLALSYSSSEDVAKLFSTNNVFCDLEIHFMLLVQKGAINITRQWSFCIQLK